ncbi:MAG: hypothetical protein A2V79_00100 [Betaproteobacteria bacterium RBG_16_56_24]|nr:MAG: hypothetical protein A2V79_00100 [Betaproteobacteria bacterium RBG_16_56_24]
MNCRWAKRIVTNPDILAGKPIIAGTRISVELILDCMASGWNVEKVVEAYPHISPEDVLAALAFAADVLRKKPFVTVSEIEALVEGENDFDLCA